VCRSVATRNDGERCPPRQKSRVERLKANVEPLLSSSGKLANSTVPVQNYRLFIMIDFFRELVRESCRFSAASSSPPSPAPAKANPGEYSS